MWYNIGQHELEKYAMSETVLQALSMPVTIAPKRLWTYSRMMSEMPETNQPVELWDGELLMTPAPTPLHQEISQRLEQHMIAFVQAARMGKVYHAPIDVVLTERQVVQPDILFIAQENLGIIQDRIRGVPDLVVEIISPGTWRRDRVEKRALYEQHGVGEYWIVDPEAKTVEVYHLRAGGYALHGRFVPGDTATSILLQGFSIAVDAILN